jgi:hypothetical protein
MRIVRDGGELPHTNASKKIGLTSSKVLCFKECLQDGGRRAYLDKLSTNKVSLYDKMCVKYETRSGFG